MPEQPDDQRPNELIAYLDGELSQRESEEIERQMNADPALRRQADELKRAWDLLDYLPQPEPSSTFASRTLDRLSVVRPATAPSPSRRSTASTSAISATSITPARNPWLRRVALACSALVVFGIGYAVPGAFFKKVPVPLTQEEMEQQMAQDLRVIDHLTLYEKGDDLRFVAGLDQPDLFGESP
jgi:anti-sigma factor RsiW